MATRRASCCCGALTATCEGEPFRVSVCHCLACQQRTGSAFAVQARWRVSEVSIEGKWASWVREAESGRRCTFHFCPTCGSSVWYTAEAFPDAIAIPVGLLRDPGFPPPQVSVWEAHRHPWVSIAGEIEHHD